MSSVATIIGILCVMIAKYFYIFALLFLRVYYYSKTKFCDITGSTREWTEEGQLWVQYVSSTPATRQDVITLQVCLLTFHQ
jgi:hypothetical protein